LQIKNQSAIIDLWIRHPLTIKLPLFIVVG